MPQPSNGVPGPGAYEAPPSFGHSGLAAIILPQSPREWQPPVNKAAQDNDGTTTSPHNSPRRHLPDIAAPRWQVPPIGTYDVPEYFGSVVSPRSQLHGTPRSDKVIFNVDLADRSRQPGPGQYNMAVYRSMVGRDRTYRVKLPIERVNVMANTIKSPRRKKIQSPHKEA